MFWVIGIDIQREQKRYTKLRPTKWNEKEKRDEQVPFHVWLLNQQPKPLKEFAMPETAETYAGVLINQPDKFKQVGVRVQVLAPGSKKPRKKYITLGEFRGFDRLDVEDQINLKSQLSAPRGRQ